MTRLWQAAYDAQLRARTPPFPGPLGAVFEQDGPIVRAHYGTHGTVDHRDLGPDLDPVIRRQQEAFAARAEPVRWKVHVNDPPELARRLVAAGFTPGWERPVLVAEIDGLSAAPVALPPGQRLTTGVRAASALDLAANSGPHRTALTESIADGDYEGWNRDVSVVDLGGRARAAGWAILVDGTEFVSVGGLSAPEPAFLPAWIAWIARRTRGRDRWRYFVAEAGGDLRQMLLGAGFRQVTTVRSYHWAPPGHPAAQRPVVLVFDDPAADAVWQRFRSHWAVSGDSRKGPAPTEPPDSVTWNLGAIDGNEAAVEELDRIIRRGLRAVVRPGERVYALNAHTQGYHFDPHRTGEPGQPPVPRSAYPCDGDDRLFTTADLRTGTFGDPWEDSLCVFGADLLREVQPDLTALLRIVLRRGGRPAGNVWTFDPDGNTITEP